MKIQYGYIKNVYIPTNNGDIMSSNMVGFIIDIDGKLYKYEIEQNEENSNIMKNDKVDIITQIIDNHRFVDIRKSGGE